MLLSLPTISLRERYVLMVAADQMLFADLFDAALALAAVGEL